VLTFFTTAKPFRGHVNVIQRNALKSWTLLHPNVEVIVFGDDEGAADVARELGIRHEGEVKRTEFGAMRLDDMFEKAQVLAKHEVLCYVNCDIILMSDFRTASERVLEKYRNFLMVGRRWDTPITEPVDFSDPGWDNKVRTCALSENNRRDEVWIDYFAFSRGLYLEGVPPLGIGRLRWDHWLVWKAIDSKVPVVDASPVVAAVHQNHDYAHHRKGWDGVWQGEEAELNLRLCGGWDHTRSIADATLVLHPSGFERNALRYWRVLTKAWLLGRDLEELRVRAPGRFWHFVHRCRFNVVYGGTMSLGHLTYRWAHTFFELIVGRKRSHYLEGIRTRIKRLMDYVGGHSRPAEQGRS
jgi:hypothetical protein